MEVENSRNQRKSILTQIRPVVNTEKLEKIVNLDGELAVKRTTDSSDLPIVRKSTKNGLTEKINGV